MVCLLYVQTINIFNFQLIILEFDSGIWDVKYWLKGKIIYKIFSLKTSTIENAQDDIADNTYMH